MTSPARTTVDDLRAQLESEAPGVGGQLFDSTLAAVRRYCGWHVFPERIETVLLDGSGESRMQLPSLHVSDVESVRQVQGDSWEPVDVSWSTVGLLRVRCGRFTDEYRGVEVTLTHGFADCPDVLKLVCDAARREIDNPMRLSSRRVGERQESYATSGLSGVLFGSEFAVLDQYRLNKEV